MLRLSVTGFCDMRVIQRTGLVTPDESVPCLASSDSLVEEVDLVKA